MADRVGGQGEKSLEAERGAGLGVLDRYHGDVDLASGFCIGEGAHLGA